jgi:hypothetical protein
MARAHSPSVSLAHLISALSAFVSFDRESDLRGDPSNFLALLDRSNCQKRGGCTEYGGHAYSQRDRIPGVE